MTSAREYGGGVESAQSALAHLSQAGVLEVVIDLPQNLRAFERIEFRVKHEHTAGGMATYKGPYDHFGTIVFHRGHPKNLGMGQ